MKLVYEAISFMCVCVCVCAERERERERESGGGGYPAISRVIYIRYEYDTDMIATLKYLYYLNCQGQTLYMIFYAFTCYLTCF